VKQRRVQVSSGGAAQCSAVLFHAARAVLGWARVRATYASAPPKHRAQLAGLLDSAQPQFAIGTCEAAARADQPRLGSAARRGAFRCAALRCTNLIRKKSEQPL